MTPIAHAGEELFLVAAIGSGALTGSLLVLRAGISHLAHRRARRRH